MGVTGQQPQTHLSQSSGDGGFEVAMLLIAVVVIGPFAFAAGWLIAQARVAQSRVVLVSGAVAGVGGLYLARGWIESGLLAMANAFHRAHASTHPGVILPIALHHLWHVWLLGLFAAPMIALIISSKSSGSLEVQFEHRARRDRAQAQRRERRLAKRAFAHSATPEHRHGLFLGYHLGGDEFLPRRRGRVFLPWRLGEHPMLVIGATGSGKTETLLRLAASTVQATDTTVIYLDGKGDRRNKHRFEQLMLEAGRSVRSFPDEPFDGWQGDASEQANRLLELIDYASEGGGTYYRDIAVKLVRLACQAPPAPPRSTAEFLERLDLKALAGAYGLRPGTQLDERLMRELDSLDAKQVSETRARYEAFFGTLGNSLDGHLHFGQLDTAYFLLDGLRLKFEAGYLARFLIEDFTQWAVGQKPRDQQVLLIVDEFSAIAEAASSLVDLVERTRGFGVTTILAPQTAHGMGGPEATARILGSVASVFLHQTPTPEQMVDIAGTRRSYTISHQLDVGAPTGLGSARLEHEYTVDPNTVRKLKPGQCYLISAGHAAKLQIAPAHTGAEN